MLTHQYIANITNSLVCKWQYCKYPHECQRTLIIAIVTKALRTQSNQKL